MIKLLTIIGARPQIIKAAAISRAIAQGFAHNITEKILHTGQHYDPGMSQVFFDELGIPRPDYQLNAGSGLHGEQTAKMITGIEKVLLAEHVDGVILYGDTNSTLAGAIATSKLQIPIFHVEAGLRSYNMHMPEEINRVVCDQLSTILFAPTHTAVQNLVKEGYDGKREVYNSGDVMYDNSMYYAEMARKKSTIINDYGLVPQNFILATIHRDNNTDTPKRLSAIFRALLYIAGKWNTNIVLPLHPRTAKLLEKNVPGELLREIRKSDKIRLLPPVSFLDMISLEENAQLVITDSGGVQKEAFFFNKPCVIVRAETEWVEIVSNKAGIIADADYHRIIDAYEKLINTSTTFPPLFGNGAAATLILSKIEQYYNS